MRSFTRLPVFVSLFALIPLTSLAQQVRYAGSLLWNQCNDVEVVMPTAYCVFENGLMILDVSDPDTVFAYSRVFCQGEGRKVDIAENYAFLADGTAGLQISIFLAKSTRNLSGNVTPPAKPAISPYTEIMLLSLMIARASRSSIYPRCQIRFW